MYSPLRYPGGKTFARAQILDILPSNERAYVEPFCGGASIFFAKTRAPHCATTLNDSDSLLINCLRHIRDRPNRIADIVEQWPVDKETHGARLAELRADAATIAIEPSSNSSTSSISSLSTQLLCAARYFYLNRTSYSGIMCLSNCHFAFSESKTLKQSRWRERLRCASQHLKKVKLTNVDFEQCIDAAPDEAVLFVDPPYYARRQAQLYSLSLDAASHDRLRRCLQRNSHRLQFLLTYDDCEPIRQMYAWAPLLRNAKWQYAIGRTDAQQRKQGEQEVEVEDDEKKVGKSRAIGEELFISNIEKRDEKEEEKVEEKKTEPSKKRTAEPLKEPAEEKEEEKRPRITIQDAKRSRRRPSEA